MRRLLTAILTAACLSFSPDAQAQTKVAGGDISLLTKYEEHGAKYYDHDGNAISSVLEYLKSQGWNAMRLRLFVDSENASAEAKGQGVCQDEDYVIALGKRIKDAGMKLMIDFHYSDTWADPSNQWTPDRWASFNDDAEKTAAAVEQYTMLTLSQMADNNVVPDYIQIGNEISYGMLWGINSTAKYKIDSYHTGTAAWTRFLSILKGAAQACRSNCPDAKIIIHSERVADATALKNFYNQMSAVDYDIIGLSYYPYFHGSMTTLETALKTLESGFSDKEIMIVETGYPYAWEVNGSTYDFTSTYPYSDAGQKAFTDDLITMLSGHEKVTGLFWWFPEANEYGLDWSTNRVTDGWYNASLVDNRTGRFGSAASSIRNFLGEEAGIESLSADDSYVKREIFSADGIRKDRLSEGLNIIRETSSSGSVRSRKVIAR